MSLRAMEILVLGDDEQALAAKVGADDRKVVAAFGARLQGVDVILGVADVLGGLGDALDVLARALRRRAFIVELRFFQDLRQPGTEVLLVGAFFAGGVDLLGLAALIGRHPGHARRN